MPRTTISTLHTAIRKINLDRDGISKRGTVTFGSLYGEERMKIVTGILFLTTLVANSQMLTSPSELSAISGKVTSTVGVLAAAKVTVFELVSDDGHLLPFSGCETQTDTAGRYTCTGLPEGKYIVMVRSTSANTDMKSLSQSEQSAITFFPSVSTIDDAERIVLRPHESRLVNVTVPRGLISTVSGVLVAHPRRATVQLLMSLKGIELETGITGKYEQESGRFEFTNVPSGDYVVKADWIINNVDHYGSAAVTANSASAKSVVLEETVASGIVGSVSFEEAVATLAEGSLSLDCVCSDHVKHFASRVSNGKFVFESVPPGEYALSWNGGPNQFAKAVTVGGEEVSTERISVPAGTSPLLMNVLLSPKGGTLAGVLRDADPSLLPIIVAVSDETGMIRTSTPDQSLHFALSGLPPGLYHIFGWAKKDEPEYASPLYRSGFVKKSAAVSLEERGKISDIEVSLG